MDLIRESVLDININIVTLSSAFDYVKKNIIQKEKTHIVTLNAEMTMLGQSDSEFKKIVNNASLVIPDGSGVIWALGRKGKKTEKVAGIELSEKFIKNGLKVFLLGSTEEVILNARNNLINKYKKNNIVGFRNGFFDEKEESNIIQQINELKPDILLVGLGVPRQEKWISKNKHKINAPILMGVGGSFDVFSGKINRAPKMMIKLHLEWLYRLYKEPSRWRRMLVLPKFVKEVYFKDQSK